MTDRSAIVRVDKRRLWHPYTPMQAYIDETDPLVVARAEGARLYDLDGRSYLDGNASWWAAVLGHGHPRLVAALRRQSERLCHVALAGITHEAAARLADELCLQAPAGLERVFFSDDGSTAVEVAMKLALGMWHNQGRPERRRFVALEGAFHGDTLGATGLGGVPVFRAPFAAALPEVVHLPRPPARADLPGYGEAVARLGAELAEGAEQIAAVVVEPLVQGAAGMRTYAPAYLGELRRLCDRHDLLLVFDEVFSGYGRTGTMWASEQAGVAPDILCSAKGLSGGMLPLGATLVSERVFEAFLGDPERAFWYGHTYCGNPLGTAVAREVLAVYRDERVLEGIGPRAARIAETFERLGALDGVAGWRALGMIGALDLSAEAHYLGKLGWRVHEHARARGAYLRPLGDVVYVTPPLNIPEADLEELLAIVCESVMVALNG
jgi:adenosylmethionine-8-amino-7-oxononanoate aminotransferase